VGGGTLASVTANGNSTATGIIVTANGISGNVISINGNGTTTGDALLFPQFSASNTTYADRTSIWALNRNVLGIGFSQAAGNPKVINFNSDLLSQGITQTYYLPAGNGELALGSYGITGYDSNPNSSFANSQFYSGLTSPLESHVYNIGVTGTGQATSADANRWGVGVYGAGYTNGGTRCAGVKGDGEVTNSSDTGSAIGVRGYATATHAGGLNIGLFGEASGSSTGNYGVYTNMTAAANTFANYHLGTALSYFGGNVLIATTTSAGSVLKLQIGDGTADTRSYFNPSSQYALALANSNSNAYYLGVLTSGSTSSFVLHNAAAGVNPLTVTYGGNVLINTTTLTGAGIGTSGTLQVNNEIFSGGTLGGFFWANRSATPTSTTNWYGLYTTGGTIFFYSAGNGNVSSINATTGIYTPLSDINKKKDFELSNIGLNAILNLKPTLYRMKKEDNTEKHLGFIAQEVKEFIPQAYVENNDFIGLDYNPIVATLVKAVQELNKKLERNNIN
jgi:hypothetical protein